MQRWTFDRTTIADPILQLGWTGLALLLHYGEGNDRYPEIKQTDRLRWSQDETTITIEFEGPKDLNAILGCPLGDFRDGIGIVPGYEWDPNRPAFYATGRAHSAICGGMFSSKRGKRRSNSLNTAPKRKKHETIYGPVVQEIANLETTGSSENKPEFVTIKVTPHRREEGKDRITIPLNAKGELAKKAKFGKVIHPGLAEWNHIGVKGSPQDYFLASFSCLAYFWTHSSEEGSVGLGNNAPTLTEARARVRRWAHTKVLHLVTGGHEVAFWAIAATLKLPGGSYPTMYTRDGTPVVGSFQPQTLGDYDRSNIYRMLEEMSEIVGPKGAGLELRRLSGIPVRVHKDKTITVLDVLFHNMGTGRKWCVGLGDGVNLKKEGRRKTDGWFRKEKESLSLVLEYLGGPVERQVAKKMNSIFNTLGYSYREVYGKKAWDKATSFAVSVHLNRANTYGSLLKALNEIRKEVRQRGGHSASFTGEEFDWILREAKRDLVAVKHLLILACGGVSFSKDPTQESKDE